MATKLKASVAAKIRFTHVPADGRTPVFNGTTRKWEYAAKPTDSQLSDSADRLLATDQAAADAKLQATQAVSAASSAISAAESALTEVASKASMEEAVEEARQQFFRAYDIAGKEISADRFEMRMTADGWILSFCTSQNGIGTCGILGYATMAAFRELEDRVADLEARLDAIGG